MSCSCHGTTNSKPISRHKNHLGYGKVEHMLLNSLTNIEFIIFDKSIGMHSYKNLRAQMHGRQFDVLLHMQAALRASVASLFIPLKN